MLGLGFGDASGFGLGWLYRLNRLARDRFLRHGEGRCGPGLLDWLGLFWRGLHCCVPVIVVIAGDSKDRAQLVAAGRYETLPMAAVTLSSGGNRALSAVFALALALPPLLAFLIAALAGRPRWR